MSALLPKVECELNFARKEFSITGNKKKSYTLLSKSNKDFNDIKFTFYKTLGRAKATFTIFINRVKHEEWVFEGTIKEGEHPVELTDIAGKEVSVIIKNHSATKRIKGLYVGKVGTNSMFLSGGIPHKSNHTFNRKIVQFTEMTLSAPCTGRATVEVTRLRGNSSAEIVISQGNTGNIVLKAETIGANETSKRINLNNITSNGRLKLEMRNIETNKFTRARLGAWFN